MLGKLLLGPSVCLMLVMLFSASATGQSLSGSVTVSQTEAVATQAPDLATLSARVGELEGRVNEYVGWAKTVGIVSAVIAFFVGLLGREKFASYVSNLVEAKLAQEVNSAVDRTLPDLLSSTQRRAEEFLLSLAKLLALKSSHAYDEALTEYGWTGQVAKLRDEPPSLRRAIIECLYSAKKNRDKNRVAAWEALVELLKDDATSETDQLYLRLAISLRKIAEGLAYYDTNKERILDNKESSIRASTLLRKHGRLNEALQIAKRYRDDDDLASLVAIAVLQRDLGNFDEVHDILLPAVNRLLVNTSTDLPEGWNRLLNTFIANSLDRNRPEDALQAAEFVLRSGSGAVEIFTVGRMLLRLAETNQKRSELAERMRAAVGRLVPGEATTRCQVVLARLDNAPEKAIEILANAIVVGTLPAGKSMANDVYFHRCNIGEILTEIDRSGEAIDYLMPAAAFNYGGEAKFRLSIAYAKQAKYRDSARWLDQAIEESPKWIGHARDQDDIKRNEEAAKVLAKHGTARTG